MYDSIPCGTVFKTYSGIIIIKVFALFVLSIVAVSLFSLTDEQRFREPNSFFIIVISGGTRGKKKTIWLI